MRAHFPSAGRLGGRNGPAEEQTDGAEFSYTLERWIDSSEPDRVARLSAP